MTNTPDDLMIVLWAMVTALYWISIALYAKNRDRTMILASCGLTSIAALTWGTYVLGDILDRIF